jgi:hypothetical protein
MLNGSIKYVYVVARALSDALTQGDNPQVYREGKEDLCSQLEITF